MPGAVARSVRVTLAAVPRAQFDPVVRQHVLFSEQKLSRTKKKKG